MHQRTYEDLLHMTGCSEYDREMLRAHAAVTEVWAEDVAAILCDALCDYEGAAQVFLDGERSDRESTMRDWYLSLVRGDNTAGFWRSQWTIGLVHIQRGVTNALMLGTTSRMQQLFLAKCMQEFEPHEAIELYGAFKRVADVAAGLIAESFFTNYVQALECVAEEHKALRGTMLHVKVGELLQQQRRTASSGCEDLL